jgi:hypothetical protein
MRLCPWPTAMTLMVGKLKMKQVRRSLLARMRAGMSKRTNGTPLNGPIGRVRDGVIDSELAKLELRRRDLFSPETIGAGHRYLMARMIRASGVDLDKAVETRWHDIKRADEECAYCGQRRRCADWLRCVASQGASSSGIAPKDICPNAQLFNQLSAS